MRLFLQNDHLVLDFPYDAQQVAEIKKIENSSWDRVAQVWRVPVSSLEETREFAARHHFDIDADVLILTIPKKRPTKAVYLDEGKLIMTFPYEKVIIKAVKQIPGITWNPGKKAWQAPMHSVAEVVKWAESFDIHVDSEIYAHAGNVHSKLEQLKEASRSTDASITVHGLQGELLPYQRAGVRYASSARRSFIADEMGLGKACTVNSMILTPTGWTTHGKIKVGDTVIGSNGKPIKVLGVYPQGVTRVFRVTFTDGTYADVSPEHLWNVQDVNARKRENSPWKTLSTEQMFTKSVLSNGRYKFESYYKKPNGDCRWYIPMVEPVEMYSQPVPIDPYVLGCLLGDGTLGHHSVQLTTADDWMIDHIRSKGYAVNKLSAKYQYGFTNMLTRTRGIGIQGHGASTKYVPKEYLNNDIDVRVSVLQGLMDTDGHISKNGTVQFTTISKRLAKNVQFLVESLGGVARISKKIPTYTYLGEKKEGKLAYTLTIRMNINPFRMPRKSEKWAGQARKYPPSRGIVDIIEIEPQETLCIRVDAPNHLYVIQNCIVTHNTLQAIATLEYVSKDSNPYPAVVVCPPTLVLNWKAEYSRWLPHRTVATVTNRKEMPAKGSYDVVVVGYSNVSHWEKQLAGHNSYVFDESHYCKTPSAARTKSAVKIAKTAPKDGIVLCLTGTPVTNRPAEYASQLDILGKLKDFGGLWGFYRRYCNAYQDNFGQWNISGHSHLDELNDRLRGNCYIRRTKDQVLSELPPVIHAPIVVEGVASGMAEYRKAEKDIIKYLQDRAREIAIELGQSPRSAAVIAKIKAESNEHLVRLSVLRRLSAKAKMPVIEEWVQERVDDGKKVVIAAHHREIVDELARKFGGLKIQGGMSVEEVEEHKKKFQTLPASEAPVIVLSIQAAKTGHTLTAAQDVLFVELPWTPADVDQTYSRCHRLGQVGSVTATYILASQTIDEEIYSLIERKRGVVTAAVEGGLSVGGDASQLILDLMNR